MPRCKTAPLSRVNVSQSISVGQLQSGEIFVFGCLLKDVEQCCDVIQLNCSTCVDLQIIVDVLFGNKHHSIICFFFRKHTHLKILLD